MAKRKEEKKPYYFELGKIPPHAVDIEESILGNMITEPIDTVEFVFGLLKPKSFYKDSNQKIFQALIDLKEADKPLDMLSVINQLKENEHLDEIGGPFKITELTSRLMPMGSLKYHCLIVIEKYILREIIHVCSTFVNKAFESKIDIFKLLEEIKIEIERIETITNINNVNARDALKDAVQYIDDIAEGKKLPYLKSGMKKFDYAYGVNTNQIVVFAAQKGHLKTRTLVKLVRGWIEYNIDVAILWYSMEEPASKMSRLSICHSTGIDDQRMLGKRKPKLSVEERQNIAQVSEEMWHDDIEYKETGSSIQSIKNNFITFCKKRPDKKHILIIDNYGRTKSGIQFRNSNDEDDYIANQYVDIRDATKGLIFIVHHLTKAQLARTNIETGYRPREEDVRGSSRIIDYCNTLILGNFIAKHKDLIETEKHKEIERIEVTHDPFPECYLNPILKINSVPDRNHKDTTMEAFKRGIVNTINHVFNDRNLKEKFPDLSRYQASEEIIKRYHNYVSNMRYINKNRSVGFHSAIDDPLTYLFKGKYMVNIQIDKETKEYYLYGENFIDIKPKIKNLLILDAPKVRDGEPDDEIVLIRFYVHPGKMQYEEL